MADRVLLVSHGQSTRWRVGHAAVAELGKQQREPALARETDRRVVVGEFGEVVTEAAVDADQVGPDPGCGFAWVLRPEVIGGPREAVKVPRQHRTEDVGSAA